MEKYKEKFNVLKLEIDQANARADKAENRIASLQTQLGQRETDIAASQAKLATLEDEMDLAVQRAGAAKQQRIDDDAVEGQQLAIKRKVAHFENDLNLLNAKLEDTAKLLKSVVDRNEKFAAKAQELENEREATLQKTEDMAAMLANAKKELEQTLKSLEDM